MAERLDYATPHRPKRLEPHWALFFPTYCICALAGLMVSGSVEARLWGRVGDEVVVAFKVASIVVVMAIAGILYTSSPRHWIVARWLLATVGGFTSFAGAYLVLLIFFR
jgi:hypothetical protein